MHALYAYLYQFSNLPTLEAVGNERLASLINAYNAFTLYWVLQNYPTDSILTLNDSWTKKRHKIGGTLYSLDQIEHENLRPGLGWKVHAAIVCAARSCPPLQPYAYQAKKLNNQLKNVSRIWLARLDLNTYYSHENKVSISKIFAWFKEDFESGGGVRRILSKYAPKRYQKFLKNNQYDIEFKVYRWGLNDQNGKGKDFS